MIGITGTKGKTTVAYLLRSVLKAVGFKVGMIGTVEIDDGKEVVPAEMTTPGVVELVELFGRMRDNGGATHCVMGGAAAIQLHQKRVAGIDFAVGIFTNLTGDHLDYHNTMEEYAAAKAILFEGLKEGAVAVVNGDDAWVERILKGCGSRVVPYRIAMVRQNVQAVGPPSLLHIAKATGDGSLLGLRRAYDSKGLSSSKMAFAWVKVRKHFLRRAMGGPPRAAYDIRITTPLVGRHNAYNLLAVIAAADTLGIDICEIKAGLSVEFHQRPSGDCSAGSLSANQTREEMPFQVFVDYAHTHDALENVLTALRTVMGDFCPEGLGKTEPRP